MYAEWSRQAAQLARFSAAFLALYVAVPRLVWRVSGESLIDRFWKRYVRMVAFTIALVYCLVLANLYEVISFVCCVGLLAFQQFWFGPNRHRRTQRVGNRLAVPLYDTLDGLVRPTQYIRRFCQRQFARYKNMVRSLWTDAGSFMMLVAVLGYSAYLRFYDAVTHAAPAMSDAYVTLAWLKYIERKTLFHDGIYPHGFHIILSTLHKFAGQDALYTLKYTGPLCGVLTAFGLYYVVWRLTGRKSAGLMAALAYGVLGAYLPMDWARQAATNSQEFALIFLAPAWYFAHCYLTEGKQGDWWAALCSFLIIGWVHTLIYAFLFAGLCCLGAAHLIGQWKMAIKRAWPLLLAAVISGLLAALPMGIGFLLGKELHSSSVEFITSKMAMPFPMITWIDKLALFGLLTSPLLTLFGRERRRFTPALFTALLGIASYFLYEYLGPVTGNAVLVTRSNLLWSLTAAIGCGLAWNVSWSVVSRLAKWRLADLVAAMAAIGVAVIVLVPQPALPYKMQTDNMVEQYLRISGQYRPTEWMIVSASEGYALVLGQGYHLMLENFLQGYAASTPGFLQTADGEELLTPDVFVYREKVVYETAFDTMRAEYARRAVEYGQIQTWLDAFRQTHDNLSLFYQDDTLEVWHIDQRNLLAQARIVLGRP